MHQSTSSMLQNPFWHGNFADPFILKVRGHYYAYGTEPVGWPEPTARVIPILSSSNLVDWQSHGRAMPGLGAGYHDYWAPEVTEYNGEFLLYYAVHHLEEFKAGIRVAVSDQPTGPFEDSGHDLTHDLVPWAIDPHVFQDQDGQWYLFMTIEYLEEPSGMLGSGNAMIKLSTPFTTTGPLTRSIPPRYTWQLFKAKREEKGGVDWYTVEGPTVIRHRRFYYQTYSGGRYSGDNYAVSYARSRVPMGPEGIHDNAWLQEEMPPDIMLLKGDGKHLISPGHNSIVAGPNNADLYIAYHAWQPDMVERRPCLDRLFWHGEQLWTPAPTHTPQPRPTLPRFHADFAELDATWETHNGRWKTTGEAVVQEDTTVDRALLQQRTLLSTAWLLEVNLRSLADNGNYGVCLQADDQTMLTLALLPETHELALYSSQTPDQVLRSVPLPADRMLKHWHQLLISKSGAQMVVQLDGRVLFTQLIPQHLQTFALATHYSSAAFSGICLTDHFEDEFLDESLPLKALGWHSPTPANESIQHSNQSTSWRIQDDALVQNSTAPGEQVLLKDLLLSNFDYGATFALQELNAEQASAAGLTVHYQAGTQLSLFIQQQQQHWELLCMQKDTQQQDTLVQNRLPSTFDPATWHSLHLHHHANHVTVRLDGQQLADFNFPTTLARTGLSTSNASVKFIGVWQTGIA